jgi:hypothetical protein
MNQLLFFERQQEKHCIKKMGQRCTPGSKKFAKRVKACNGEMKCIKFGDKTMSIKKHISSNKKSFCARHKCHEKREKATPGYQSCKKWNCKVGSCSKRKTTITQHKIKNPKTGRMVLRTSTIGKSILKRKSQASRNKTYTSKSGRKYSKCWSGYKRHGWKTKNGRRVPNCVKKR